MADLVQNADNSVSVRNELDGLDLARWGGPSGPSPQSPRWGGSKTVKLPLAANDSAGGIFSWVNPEPVAIVVTSVYVDATTPSSGACAISIGTTAVSGATVSANLIDTLSLATAGTFDTITDKGTNGRSRQRLAVGAWVTGSTVSGASAGLAGNVYITYLVA
ncbi:MAG: hypothetical protein JO010_02340 [Alphaproteobacteria bacterium]|nr:hypothetical protein [Alphaproteobacteria bacterium]